MIDDENRNREERNNFDLGSIGASISWKHNWTPRFSAHLSGFYTNYNYDYKYELGPKGAIDKDKADVKKSKIQEQQLHFYNNYQTKRAHLFRVGYQLSYYDVAYEVGKASKGRSQRDIKEEGGISGLHVLYGTFNTAEDKNIGLDVGFRLNYFEKKKKIFLEPRLRLWYNPTNTWNLYANAGKYDQFLSQLVEIQGDKTTMEIPVWALAGTREVPVLHAWHVQTGAVFRKKSWLIDFQLYYRYVEGLTSLATGFDENLVEDGYDTGDSESKGLDILIKKRWKNYRVWLSYSLSKFEYKFPDFFDKKFPAPIDQRHILNIANLWHWKNFEFSLGWKIATGSPFSRRENFRIEQADTNEPETIKAVINQYNDVKLPLQHQLDGSILYNFLPKNTRNWKIVAGLSLFNLYHQKNIYNRDIFIDNRPDESSRLEYSSKANLGFTPNVVARVEW